MKYLVITFSITLVVFFSACKKDDDIIQINTYQCGTPITYMGKTYQTVKIGSQCWLKENLNVGTMILGGPNQTNNNKVEKYCYNNDTANCDTYGGLYQWNEAMQYFTNEATGGICPKGWHIPTRNEIETLNDSLYNNGNLTNIQVFSDRLCGFRDTYGDFVSIGNNTFFWTSSQHNATDAVGVYLIGNDSLLHFYRGNYDYGFSIRCLKD